MSGGENLFRAGRYARLLVDLNADSVTRAVAEEFAVARVGYDIARGFVRVGAGDAGSHLLHRGELRFEDGVVYLLLLFAYGADCDGSRHVAVVSADDCAVVHGDEVAAFNLFVRGHAVRHRGVDSADCNSLKRERLRAVSEHIVVEFELNLALGHAGLYEFKYVVECALGYRLRLANELHFVVGFYHSERVYRAVGVVLGADACVGHPLCELLELGDGESRRLNGEVVYFEFAHQLRQLGAQIFCESDGADGYLLLRRLDIARVGEEYRAVSRNEQNAVRRRERGEIAPVLLGHYQRAVELRRQKRKKLVENHSLFLLRVLLKKR